MSMQQIMIAFQYFNISAGKDGIHLKDRIEAINPEETGINSENEIKNEKDTEADKTVEKQNLSEKNENRFLDKDDINRFKPKN